MFAPIEGFSNYRVCNEGYIVHFPSMFKKSPVNNNHKHNKYVRVNLRGDDKKLKMFALHRLVCQMFHPNPHGHKMVDHIDGNENNNHFLNLRWVSGSESNYNKIRRGTRKYIHGIDKPYGRYRVHIKHKFKSFETYLEAAKCRLQLEKEVGVEFFRNQIPEKVTLEILNEIIDGF